jgi:hypothetical protein
MAEEKTYDNLPDITEEERSNDIDINAILNGRKKEIAETEQKSQQTQPAPPVIAPTPNYRANPNDSLAQYYGAGNETPQMNLNTEDIFPGYEKSAVLDMASAPMIGSYPLLSAANYIPYNIIAKRQTALNNAAIQKHKHEAQMNKLWDYDPSKTPGEYTAEYNESFYSGIGDLHNKFVKQFGGNSVAATEASQTPGTPQYQELHNYLGNMQALSENLNYVNDFAQRVAGTKAKSPLARYYPPEAFKIATDVLSGHVKLSDLGKDGKKVSDLVDQMRGYDNLITTLSKPEFKSMLQPDIQSIMSRTLSSRKDAAGKYIVDEKKLKDYAVPDATIKRVMDILEQSRLSFPDSQLKKMPQIIGDIMKSYVRETETKSTETPPNVWEGKGYDKKKMWFTISPPRQVAGGYRSTAPGFKFGQNGAPDLPVNTFEDTQGNEVTGKPIDVLNYGTVDNPNLFMELHVPVAKKTKEELAQMRIKEPDKYATYLKDANKFKSELVPLSGQNGEGNRDKFSGEYSIQDVNDWYKDAVKGYAPSAPSATSGTKSGETYMIKGKKYSSKAVETQAAASGMSVEEYILELNK